MPLNVAGKYPWRFGVTSYLLPADLITNVRHIAGQVDDVQLLFFESAGNTNLSHPVDKLALKEIAEQYGLTYSVHLPTDIRLGALDASLRKQGIEEIERLVEALNSLEPVCYDLHLNKEEIVADAAWLENLATSLSALKNRLGEKATRIAIENIDYPLALIWDLIGAYNFGLCLDMGHILKYGHDWQNALVEYLPLAQHIHYHGVHASRDHQSITAADLVRCQELGAAMHEAKFKGVLTLELYSYEKLQESIDIFKHAWQAFER